MFAMPQPAGRTTIRLIRKSTEELGRVTAPEPDGTEPDDQQETQETVVPPVSPAYSTPPPEGLPDADQP
jgi:hypothetical protein